MAASKESAKRKSNLNQVKTRSRPNRMELVRAGRGSTGLPSRGLVTVSIDRVHDNPINERKTFTNMEGLIDSIRDNGIIEPPTAIPHPSIEGHVQLLTGSRRFRAAKELGYDTFTVNITSSDDTERLRIKSLISNIQREDVPAVELAQGLKALLEQSEDIKTQRELAKRLGKDETWVSGMFRILSMKEPLKESLSRSDKSVSYDTAIRIARVNNEEKQAELIDEAVNGATHREIRKKIAESKEKQPTKKYDSPSEMKVHTIKLKDATVTIRFKGRAIGKEARIAVLEDALAVEQGKSF